jgi:hypothetical protein
MAHIRTIKTWAQANVEKIKEHASTAGGWEGWAQCELAYAINHAPKGISTTVRAREEYVYKVYERAREQQADIVVESALRSGDGAGSIAHHRDIIELKCQSKKNKKFISEVMKDIEKVQEDNFKSRYLPACVWVVAISTQGMAHEFRNNLSYFNEVVIDQEVSVWHYKWTVESLLDPNYVEVLDQEHMED